MVMDGQKKQLSEAITSAPEKLSGFPDDEVIQQYVSRFELEVPTLSEDAMSMSEREVDIDVSRDPRRLFFEGHPDGFYIKGTEVTVHIPFVGEPDMFRVRPNMWSSVMPRGHVDGQELLLRFRFPHDSPPSNLKSELDRALTQVRQYLDHLRSMVAVMHRELRIIAAQSWQTRKSQFSQRKSVVEGLGLPRKVAAPNRSQSGGGSEIGS